ncbi:hypothetical protein TP46_12230 [Xanthomonas citri pv. aurantifolii]|nr:hypothetical protein TP49_11740 [Xanthomonas citri pv. aurantifolii]TBX03197.1 hypothetical protein TP46_12230 [Xanthomonas citri pv. aurantifolii]
MVGPHYFLKRPHLGIALGTDSNNSPRKLFSALGGLITFAGAGCGFGQTLGFTACPSIAQLEIAITQASNNSSSDGRGRFSVLLMLCSDVGQSFGLFVFGDACGLLISQGVQCNACPLVALGHIGRSVAPFPASPEAEHQQASSDCQPQLDRHFRSLR